MNKHISIAVLAAAAALCSSPALALTFEGATTQGATVATPYVGNSLISFDLDFANAVPATLEFRIDEEDLLQPIAFNAILRNYTGRGVEGYALSIDKGRFETVGTVVRQFAGSTQVSANAGLATLYFNTPEFLDIEIGNALGTTLGAVNWTLSGLQAGDRISLTVSAVPEASTVALLLAGLLVAGRVQRRRQG